MNKFNFNQLGGFPLETETLVELEKAYTIFNSYGKALGEKVIISGCELSDNGNNVSDGYIYFNGEVFEFKGGPPLANIIVIEDSRAAEFKNGESNEVYRTRYAAFGSGGDSVSFSEFKRIDPVVTLMTRLDELEKKSAIFQQGGGMVFWNKPENEIPDGWQEVIDWRGRMPVGVDFNQDEFNDYGKQSGEKYHTLSINEMPSHSHGVTERETGSHTHSFVDGRGGNSTNSVTSDGGNFSGQDYRREWVEGHNIIGYSGDHNHSVSIHHNGNGWAHNNLPPYRTVLFIEYVG